MAKHKIRLGLHSSKEGNYDELYELENSDSDIKFSAEAKKNFCYALYEVMFEVEVDEKTGEHRILKVETSDSLGLVEFWPARVR
jgi:CO/xanthine dehydrogenase Mo-binding subunit